MPFNNSIRGPNNEATDQPLSMIHPSEDRNDGRTSTMPWLASYDPCVPPHRTDGCQVGTGIWRLRTFALHVRKKSFSADRTFQFTTKKMASTSSMRLLHAVGPLPSSDLLEVIHASSTDFYEMRRRTGVKSMDETALIAMGIMLEEMAQGPRGNWAP
ncbi:LOW QUALITY PROTEIN: hypothetical protein IFM47457_07761 [Aspergillus lentulus]|nr:LOW QUALITY PROTEIN: hypothetical protein IFM47457_07761 [Aspergillus lentulus]